MNYSKWTNGSGRGRYGQVAEVCADHKLFMTCEMFMCHTMTRQNKPQL